MSQEVGKHVELIGKGFEDNVLEFDYGSFSRNVV